MKNLKLLTMLFACIAMLALSSCTKDTELTKHDSEIKTTEIDWIKLGIAPEKAHEMGQTNQQTQVATNRSPLSFSGNICDAVPVSANLTSGDYVYGSNRPYDLYCFSGNQGDNITITITRNSCDHDAYALLFNDQWTLDSQNPYDYNGDYTYFLTSSDDVIGACGCYSDPYIQYTLPYTGSYILASTYAATCSPSSRNYTITTTGISSCNAVCGGCPDADGDGVCDDDDNCPDTPNADQADADEDGQGDACDDCPFDADNDIDADGVCGDVDNCPDTPNSDQADNDGDGEGDACDDDDDNDGVLDEVDNCQFDANTDQADYEGDGAGDVCDADDDDDGCDDDVDPHPYSNLDATVIIDGCDSGVVNVFPDACSNMSDLIADLAANATNHGEFVSAVAHLTNEWKEAGLISGAEKGAIQSCAGQSNSSGEE